MTRLLLCAIAVALAAGRCLAEPTTAERAINRFDEMEAVAVQPENSPSSKKLRNPSYGQYSYYPPNRQYPYPPLNRQYPYPPLNGQYPYPPLNGQYPYPPPNGQYPYPPPNGQYPYPPPNGQYPYPPNGYYPYPPSGGYNPRLPNEAHPPASSTTPAPKHSLHKKPSPDGADYQSLEPLQDSSTTTTTPTPNNDDTTTAGEAGDPSQWMESFMKAVRQQLELQDQYMRQFLKDIQGFLSGLSRNMNWDETQSAAFARVGETMAMISNRMTTARENVEELMATSEMLDSETLRSATNKFMKEVRVQDVVVDALWASLRGMQTTAWMSGATVAEERDAYAVANRAAEEFLSRMYHNLRTAGISEEDIVKFVPKAAEEGELMGRKMGTNANSYGWSFGSSFGYPSSNSYGYSWGYPRYGWSRYGYEYPSYTRYTGYPGYTGYPNYPSYPGYPPYYGWYGSRRLGPDCPNCPPAYSGVHPQQMVPPFRTPVDGPMGQGYAPPMMGQGYAPPMMGQGYAPPMMGQGFGSRTLGEGFHAPPMETGMTPEFPTGFEPMEPMGPSMGTMGEPTGFNSFEMPGNATGNRNLAPTSLPGFLDEPEAPNTPYEFGPAAE